MASRGRQLPGKLSVPLPSPTNSPPPIDRRTEFALVNSLWLDITSSSVAASSNPAAVVDKVRETGRVFEKAVFASGAHDTEKAALCSMWQHYDHCFSDILNSLVSQVKINKKLIALKQAGQSQSASTSELPSLKLSPRPHLPSPLSRLQQSFKRGASFSVPEMSSPNIESGALPSSSSSQGPASASTAVRGKAQAAEEALLQLELRLKREREEREVEAEKFKKKIDSLEADKRHLKIEISNLEQVINAQLHITKTPEEGAIHFRRSDYGDLPVADLLSIHTKSQEVEQVISEIERGFGEDEDMLLRLNFMMRKLRTDETLRLGGQDLEGISLDIMNAKLKSELTVLKRQMSVLQQHNQEARDRVENLEKILQNKKTELLQLVSQLNGVSIDEAEEMVRNKGNGALMDGIAKQSQMQTKVYEGRSIRVQPMPAGRWPSEIAVTIERFGIEVAVLKYGGATIDKFMTMSLLPQNVQWNEEDMPMGHSVLRAMVACAQCNVPLLLKQLSAQLQSIVAKMQTTAESAVGGRIGDTSQSDLREEKSWGRKGSAATLGAIGKLKRRVEEFRSMRETVEERRAKSLKFVAKALDPKSSVSKSELLHEVSVVISLKMRMDEEHSVLLQQQLIESRMTGALSPFLCPILQAAPPTLAAVCTMYYTSIIGRRKEAVVCVKALAEGSRSHRGSHWRLYFYSILTSMDSQSVQSYRSVSEADRKGASVRAPASSMGKFNSSKRENRCATAGAAAASSPTSSSLQFFSYVLRLLTSGHGFICASDEARAKIEASEIDKGNDSNSDAHLQRVEMQALKELLERDLFLAESIGVAGDDDIAELQRQLLLESSQLQSSATTSVSLDDVLRCMLDRYMAHQARLASLIKASFKETSARQNGTTNQYDDIIAAIHSNTPMESVGSAIRDTLMPKFPQFDAVISHVIPSLGEARTMQLYDVMSLLYDAWPDHTVEDCFAEAARYCGLVQLFLLQAAHSETKPVSQ